MKHLRLILAVLLVSSKASSAQPATLPKWRVARELRISAVSEELERPQTIVVTRDERIVVGDGGSSLISTYDTAGRRLARIGGKGAGPGEISRFNSDAQGIVGDSVWFYDQSHKRVVVVSSRGTHVRSTPFESAAKMAGVSAGDMLYGLEPRGLLSDGSMIVFGTKVADLRVHAGPEISYAAVLSASGLVTRVLGSIDRSGGSVRVATAKSTVWVVIPFVFAPIAVSSADGGLVLFVTAANGRDLADTVRVTVIRSTGDTLYSLKRVLPRTRVPDSTFADARAFQLRRLRQAGAGDVLVDAMPRSFPAVSRAFVTREGRTWLGLRRTPGSESWMQVHRPSEYLVISPLGTPEAVVSVPIGVSLTDALGDHVWGFEEDDDGFLNVVRFKILR